MKRRGLIIILGAATALICAAANADAQQKPGGAFVESELPPAPANELYDVLATMDGDRGASPQGTDTKTVEPARFVGLAKAFLAGKDGHPKDVKEGVFWLRMAILKAPDANARVFAIGRLGLVYATGEGVPVDMEAARRLWQIAGAMGDGGALYNLGQLAESEVVGEQASAQTLALAWYRRAAQAGYDRARVDAAIARVRQRP